MRKLDLSGDRFGRLLAIKLLPKRLNSAKRHWLCRCVCGQSVAVETSALRSGKTQSCGCLQRERASLISKTHGMSSSPTWRSWRSMLARCTDVNHIRFEDWGGRGIDVDPRWMSFESFLSDMGTRPSNNHTIERRENDKGYWPWNCRWATHKEQANNTRRSVFLEFNGECKTLTQWCEQLDLNYWAVRSRLVRFGWSVDRALTTPTKTTYSGE